MKEYKDYFHALKVINENCVGCTACVRVCPTEAIRLRGGKIHIDTNRCIDCGECINACKYGALLPISDEVSIIHEFKYKLAILAYCFPGQFSDNHKYSNVKKALQDIGFDDVIDEAEVTESMTQIIRDYIKKNPQRRPILSTSCPAVVRLIQVRFPSLLPSMILLESPMSVLAQYYRTKISQEHNINEENIGIFSIVPCIAQVTSVYQPEGASRPYQEGAIAVQSIYNEIMKRMYKEDNGQPQDNSLTKGYCWAVAGQEADTIGSKDVKTLAVTGIHNVIDILSKIENHQIERYDYVVLKSCVNGCTGGGLNVENPFVATNRIFKRIKEDYSHNLDKEDFFKLYSEGSYDVLPLEPRSIMELDKDIKTAITKMKKLKEIEAMLPGINCCACGSPSCLSLAEDIVQEKASLDDCLVRLRRKNRKSIKLEK